jgi:hypothetical protein
MRTRRETARIGLLTGLAIACAACSDNTADRAAAVKAERMAQWSRDPELTDALGQALVDRVRERSAGWIKHDHVMRGTLAERGRQAFLSVLPYGHCYRFVAVSGASVSDLDLALFDANNVEIARDISEDPTPDLGVQASICPGEASQYRVEVRMRRGHGDFILAALHSDD